MKVRPLAGLGLFVLAYSIIMELMLVAAVLYWPHFAENVEALRLMVPIPALKDMVDQIEEGGAFAYVAGQQYFKAGNTLGTAAAVLFAVGAIAGEAHRGTLEILLSRPHTRLRILTGRWARGAVGVCLPIFLTSATIPWLGERVDESFDMGTLMLCSFHQSCLLLAVYSLTFLFSTVGSNPTRIAILMLFLVIFEFAIYMIMKVTHWSLYRLSDIPDFMRIDATGELDWRICGPLLAVSAVLYGASVFAFRRRVP